METAINGAGEGEVSEEMEERRQTLTQKASTIKRRLAASIRFEMRKVHQNRGA